MKQHIAVMECKPTETEFKMVFTKKREAVAFAVRVGCTIKSWEKCKEV